MLLLNSLALSFGVVQGDDQQVVLKQVLVVVGDLVKNQVLELSLSLVIIGLLNLDLVSLLHLLGVFVRYDQVQHLVLKTFLCHLEIEHGNLDANFWRIVRLWKFSSNVESEFFGIVDASVSQFDLP